MDGKFSKGRIGKHGRNGLGERARIELLDGDDGMIGKARAGAIDGAIRCMSESVGRGHEDVRESRRGHLQPSPMGSSSVYLERGLHSIGRGEGMLGETISEDVCGVAIRWVN